MLASVCQQIHPYPNSCHCGLALKLHLWCPRLKATQVPMLPHLPPMMLLITQDFFSSAFTMFTNNSANSITQTALVSLTIPTPEQSHLLSPPPAIKDKLNTCLTAFGMAHGFLSNVVEKVITDLFIAEKLP